MLRGAIIGGIIGNNVTKNLPDGGTAGAIIGGILGHNSSTATGGTQRRCTVETRYNEEYQEVYSHSNITFTLDGKTYTVRFKRSQLNIEKLSYPACVGLSRAGNYPNKVSEVWNDTIHRDVKWYLRFVPMRYIGWNRNGSHFNPIKK